MPAAVIDTDVLSFQFKGDSRARLYDAQLTGRILVVSAMAIAELHYWALHSNWGQARRDRLDRHLARFVLSPVDREQASRWAQARHEAQQSGRPIGVADAWVAATALKYGIPLIAHNPGD